jgi:putative NADH-flavin reductase
MKITLFGASGKTGTEVLKQAVNLGLDVNAFVRDATKLKTKVSNIHVFTGDVLNPASFKNVHENVTVSVVVLGGIMEEGIKNILLNAKENGVGKIILMSSYPMSGSVEGMNYLKSAGMDDGKIGEMMPFINDKIAQERLVMDSGLTWVVVRPTFLNDNQKSGNYQIYLKDTELIASKNGISRADVADFIVKALNNPEFDNKVISISS